VIDSLLRDLRAGMRSLRRDVGATIFIVAIAGIGIGASTTVFSICRALVLKPLPFERPERLVWVGNGNSENLSAQTVQLDNLRDLLAQSRSWTDIGGYFAFYGVGDMRLSGRGEPERLTGVPVTPNFFAVLGVKLLNGRFFDSTETLSNTPNAVILSYNFWQQHFLGSRDVVGRSVVLDGAPMTIVGVLPESFDFQAIFTPARRADVFLPWALTPEHNRQGNTLALVGRLRDGVTMDVAQREATRLTASFPPTLTNGRQRNGFTPNLVTLHERVSGRFNTALAVLMAAVAFLMLLVCANLSNLLLVRASARRSEMALRIALGASRYRLVRQMLVESLVLAVAGAALGVGLAFAGTGVVARLQGTNVPLLNNVQVDGVVLVVTALVAVITAIGFGLLPAFHASGFAPATMLMEGTRGSTARGGRLRGAIVVSEIAVVCVLLTGAGLLARSLGRILDVQPGYTTENVLSVRVDPQRSGATQSQVSDYFASLGREVQALPGVESVGFTDALPLGDNFGWRRWDATTEERPREERIVPLVRMADEGYLATMKIPLRAGRSFTAADGATSEPVIIVNEALAKLLWPGEDPIGRSMTTSNVSRRVVGVVGNVRYFGLDRAPDIEMYLPLRQGDFQTVDIVVRSALPSAELVKSVRAALRRADPTLPIPAFHTMAELVDRSVFTRRFVVLLVGGFAMFGLLLASLGIYAVISYSVAQRTQEMGIRMALGATPMDLLTRVLGQTGKLAVLGIAIGLPASLVAAKAIRGLLYDVGASDPATFAAVLAVLAGVATCAGFIPARRATRVDPAIALRPR
jgi:putative ABC transport system permease protein